jgi:hypothetical protein
MLGKLDAVVDEHVELFGSVYSALSAVDIAGPRAVAEAATKLKDAFTNEDGDAVTAAEREFLKLARTVLGSEQAPRFKWQILRLYTGQD